MNVQKLLFYSWEPSLTVPLPLPLWSDLRLEFQDQLSFTRKAHDWIECLKYVDPLSEINKLFTNSVKKKKKKKKKEKKEQEKDNDNDSDQKRTPKNPLEDKTQWDLPLVEIDGLLPGHTYRFRLIERGSNEPEILGGTFSKSK